MYMNNQPPKTILVADDETDLREALKAMLEAANYKVVEAADGEEALALYKKTSPDAVILDLNMPKMHGLEVLKHIRAEANGATIPITILTAQDDIATVSAATVIGGFHTDYLPKADRSLSEIRAQIDQYFR